MICRVSRQSLKPFLVIVRDPKGGLGRYRRYQSRPAIVSCASGWRAHAQSPSRAKTPGVDRWSRWLV